jgi:RHS repeat-associated protein
LDSETGLYNYGARYYDPSLSLWLGVDPLSDAPENIGFSPYTYVWNNPINAIDPDGRNGDWIDNGDGTWTAEAGDSAYSLSQQAGISGKRANQLVVGEHGPNYKGSDGQMKSNIHVDDRVTVGKRPDISYTRLSSDSPATESVSSGPLSISPIGGVTADAVGGLGAGFSRTGGNFSLKNSKGLAPKFYSDKFHGNQHRTVSSSGKIGTTLGRLGTVATVGIGIYNIRSNYVQEGGFGTYTQQATGSAAGSLLGGYGGAAIGAGIGAWFGGVGAIPGGIIGGMMGGYGGSKTGELVVKEIQNP